MTDITTGLFLHGAILAALLARTRTGRGQRVEANLLESQVAALANIGQNYLLSGEDKARRWGTAHQVGARASANQPATQPPPPPSSLYIYAYHATVCGVPRDCVCVCLRQSIVPYQSFPTLSGHVVCGALNDGQFAKLRACLAKQLVGHTHLGQLSRKRVAQCGDCFPALTPNLVCMHALPARKRCIGRGGDYRRAGAR